MTTPPASIALRVRGLRKRYGDVVAVDGLSFEVRSGEVFGFLGPNGAGKTTSMRMMCGLLRPDEGTIEVLGEPLLPGSPGARRSIGVSPQELVIWPKLTCREQLVFVAGLYGLPSRAARKRADILLESMGLTEQRHRLGEALSGGMQRRLNIALAFVHDPALALLDEPQAGLDPQSRVRVREFIASLRGRTTIVLTTHDMDEAERLADRVSIIDHGRLLALDTVAALEGRGESAGIVELTFDRDLPPGLQEALGGHAAVGGQTNRGNSLRVATPAAPGALAEALREAGLRGLSLTGASTRDTTLEDVFLRLTGRSLRE